MVKQGFLNLAEDEKNNIIEAALDEFSEKDFEAASLNNIIARAGISKGSMYHYFNNKEDLYLYVIEYAMAIKSQFLGSALEQSGKALTDMSFFENLEFQMLASVDFALQHYRLHQFGLRLQSIAEGPLRERLYGDLDRAFEEHVIQMVEDAISAGEIRADFDRDFVIRILKFTLMRFTEIYPAYQEFGPEDREALKDEARKIILFLKQGLQKCSSKEEKYELL